MGLRVMVVRGRSMLPTLLDGDLLLVRVGHAAARRARTGRLVVVRLPGRPLSVKRLVHRSAGGWWVERDNPGEGVDSWQVGEVPADDQVGVVLARLWPLRRRPPSGPQRSGSPRGG